MRRVPGGRFTVRHERAVGVRHMEEASVAGESPDRSKQRESSAEPTSGSGGTVPEARESRDSLDPRIAVARDAGPSAARGGVDTATRVFSVRDVKTTESSGEDGGSDGAAAAESSGDGASASGAAPGDGNAGAGSAGRGGEDAGDTGDGDEGDSASGAARDADEGAGAGDSASRDAGEASEGGDERLREAVAQWVASADPESPTKASATAEETDEGSSPANVSDTEPADARSASAEPSDAVPADARSADAAPADARPSDEEPTDAERSAGPADAESAADEPSHARPSGAKPAGPASAGKPGDAERSTTDEPSAAKPSGAKRTDEATSDATTADARPSDEEPTDAERSAGPADAESAADEPSDARPSGAKPAGPASAGKPAVDEPADAVPADARPSADDEPSGGRASGDASSGVSESGRGRGAGAEERSGNRAGDDASKPAPKWASGSGADTDADADTEKPDASPVDQPTAVFKAPRPKPAVDQPTTMLKLGGAAEPVRDEDAAEAKAAGKADEKTDERKADAPAERTSKFVALKPLDEPRPLKATPEVTALVPQVGPERTTQQPLPPKPPLDLLAELTNTPPPPPTPLRTLGRRLKIWTPLVILLLVAFAIAQAVRPLPAAALTLTAKDTYTFDGGKTQLPWPGEGQGWMDADGVGTMGSFGKQTPVAIGSVAKTMTAYIILKNHPMKAGEEGPEIEVDATAEKEGGYDVTGDESTLNTVKAGDRLTEKQALSAVLIPSANNIARLLARWDAGSEAAFVKKMNDTAKELGMTNTTYTDPSGLKETTVSTAEDQVKLGRAFVKVPALVSISGAASWTDPSGKYWNNYNELPYDIGAIGIKTGSTTAAGGNLLFASRKKVDGKSVTLVGAVLGQHKPKILETVNAVSKTALLAAEDAVTSAKILKKGDVVGYVDDKLGGHTPVVITQDVSAVGWAGMTVKLSFTAGEVPHTAKAGTQVGTLTVGDGSSSAVKVPVALQSDLAEPGFSDKLTRIG
ncbi:D-alanyl-D-alanine carboxypeptidase [Streptomyces asoensis]|uniref:serine-type D-Ala-D-Ala carboxypeptidase n=2 Tax=Streptomyces asoensis TaxID=249586 RepID=A0ABQ3S0I0_9ACTN|nr:D-alanyl-D-alanine carboxypeptidase [Streptomyces asoensis]GHI61643.1 D-alanyl-D-alanine carboxypeptidase [Streptomyces asoensis]